MSKSETLKPLADRVVIRPNEPEKMTPGGIVIPDAAKEKTNRGEVLAVGPGRLLENGDYDTPRIAVGDVVIYDRWAGNEIDLNGDKVRVMRAGDVLAVVK
ncbi:MAG TPA: co-chaperone GroES [Pirellulaceae bacterium]|nr:co-chaperone GroES [Pirellulaceae bacterium]